MTPSALHSRCYAEISRSRIAENFRAARLAAGPGADVIAVVKANAYGHGAVEVSRVLCGEGAKWLAVSSVDEGIALREAGIEARILVMAGVMPWEAAAACHSCLTPVAHSLDDLRLFDEQAFTGVHLKLDTGLNRLGTTASAREIADTLGALKTVRLEGLLSHFASAADFVSPQTQDQIAAFERTAAALAQLGVVPDVMHLAGTNAVAYPRTGPVCRLVRPGHAIYGYVSTARGQAPAPALAVKPALSWRAKIVQVKDIPAGSHVGYGGSFVAAGPMKIAVLAAGYADGIPHRLSNKGRVIAGGQFAPMIGAVSMDLTTIDITHVPHLQPGTDVTLIGSEGALTLDAQQVGRMAGTISYTVLCGISARVRRLYVD